MNITRIEPGLDGETCKVFTEHGSYERWPGRTLPDGMQWWGFRSTGGQPWGPELCATTIRELERAFSRSKHPANPARPKARVRHLHAVHTPDDTDECNPLGIERPVVA